MLNHLHIRADEITPIADPDTNGLLWVHPDAFGQAGVPYVIKVSDPPHTTRPRHSHHGDVCYLYVQGEHHIDGEGVYRSGDVRWTHVGKIHPRQRVGTAQQPRLDWRWQNPSAMALQFCPAPIPRNLGTNRE